MEFMACYSFQISPTMMVFTQGIALLSVLASASLASASEAYPAFLLNRQAAAASSDVCPNTVWVTASQSVSTVYVTESGSDVRRF
jgi:hypothetical protein